MSPHQTIAVSVRLFAVCLAIHAGGEILSFYIASSGQDNVHALLIALSASLFVAVVILALWFFPLTIARKLLSSPKPEASIPASSDMWLSMGCALIGLWMLTSSLPALVRNSLILYFAGATYDDTARLNLWLLYYAAEVGIALWLILGAKGFKQLYWWAQKAGHNQPS